MIDQTLFNRLTPRQLQILRMVAISMSTGEIALELGIKESTVKNTCTDIFQKLGVYGRTQAAILVIGAGIVGIEEAVEGVRKYGRKGEDDRWSS